MFCKIVDAYENGHHIRIGKVAFCQLSNIAGCVAAGAKSSSADTQADVVHLQGLGKQRIPMYTLVAGVVCKIVLNYVLIAIPQINIHGAPIASLVCYSVSMIPNLYYMLKYTDSKMNWMGWIVRPGIATAAMGIVVFAMRELLPGGRLMLMLEVAVGVVVFAAAALAVKAITKEDLRAFRRRK